MPVRFSNMRPAYFGATRRALQNVPRVQRERLELFVDGNPFDVATKGGKVFTFNAQTRALANIKAVTIKAFDDDKECGYLYFSIANEVLSATMDSIDEGFTGLANPERDLEKSNLLAFRVSREYQRHFKGIGRTLLALALHYARITGAPFFEAKEDVSEISYDSKTSFYSYFGFRPQDEINILLRNAKKIERSAQIRLHMEEAKVFYLNGFFEDFYAIEPVSFPIPRIGIAERKGRRPIEL